MNVILVRVFFRAKSPSINDRHPIFLPQLFLDICDIVLTMLCIFMIKKSVKEIKTLIKLNINIFSFSNYAMFTFI